MKKLLALLFAFISFSAFSQIKISALPNANSFNGTEKIELVQGGSSKQGNLNQFRSFFFPLYSGTAIKYLSDSAGYFSWRTVSGGGGGSYVDLSTNQTVGGQKTFTNGLTIATGSTINFITPYGNDIINSSGVGRTFSLSPDESGTLATREWSNTYKFNTPTGTTSQYVRGDGSLATYGGGTTYNYQTKTANYTAATQDKFIECTGTITITLPTAVGVATECHKILNNGSGVITVVCTGGTTVSVNISFNGDAYEFVSNGTNWKIY